jgi:hypothetical protein
MNRSGPNVHNRWWSGTKFSQFGNELFLCFKYFIWVLRNVLNVVYIFNSIDISDIAFEYTRAIFYFLLLHMRMTCSGHWRKMDCDWCDSQINSILKNIKLPNCQIMDYQAFYYVNRTYKLHIWSHMGILGDFKKITLSDSRWNVGNLSLEHEFEFCQHFGVIINCV